MGKWEGGEPRLPLLDVIPNLDPAGYFSFPQVFFLRPRPLGASYNWAVVRGFVSLALRVQHAAEALFDNSRHEGLPLAAGVRSIGDITTLLKCV